MRLKKKISDVIVGVNRILLLMIILVLCSVSFIAHTIAPISEGTAKNDATVVSNAEGAPCKGLKPYKNIDELLHQLHINLESDCLLGMSTAELEKAWGTKILDEERIKPKNFYPLSENEFFNKPYKSEKDAFYITKTIVNRKRQNVYSLIFILKPTNEYFEKYGPLFSEGKPPKLLPKAFSGGKYSLSSRATRWGISLEKSGDVRIYLRVSKDSPAAAKENLKSEENEKEAGESPNVDIAAAGKNVGEVPCRGLKPFNNVDELLYQFYINLDSDCLFTMPVAELEKIWDTEILDEERAWPKNFYPLGNTVFSNKPYKSEKDAFYILKNPENRDKDEKKAHNFFLRPTNEYLEKYGELFHKGNRPKLLPESTIDEDLVIQYHRKNSDGRRHISIYMTSVMSGPVIAKIQSEIPDDSLIKNSGSEKEADEPPREVIAENAAEIPCRGLGPYNNIDELLYQFYINLDSDCLFKMPVEELEKIWNTKILSEARAQIGEKRYQIRKSADFRNKAYKSEKDAFYMETYKSEDTGLNTFNLYPTEFFAKNYGSFYNDNSLPGLLPMPLKGPYITSSGQCREVSYYWPSSDKTRGISLSGCSGLNTIGMRHRTLSGSDKKSKNAN